MAYERATDRSLINLSTPWEVQYWTDLLGVTQQELEVAVNTVGLSLKAVSAYVGRHEVTFARPM